MIVRVGESRALVVDLGTEMTGGRRGCFFLRASLARSLLCVRSFFDAQGGRFAGMASPSALVDSLTGQFGILQELEVQLSASVATEDHGREIDRQFDEWRKLLLSSAALVIRPQNDLTDRDEADRRGLSAVRPGEITGDAVAYEKELKVGVRAELLGRWLGDRLFVRCIKVDISGTYDDSDSTDHRVRPPRRPHRTRRRSEKCQ